MADTNFDRTIYQGRVGSDEVELTTQHLTITNLGFKKSIFPMAEIVRYTVHSDPALFPWNGRKQAHLGCAVILIAIVALVISDGAAQFGGLGLLGLVGGVFLILASMKQEKESARPTFSVRLIRDTGESAVLSSKDSAELLQLLAPLSQCLEHTSN